MPRAFHPLAAALLAAALLSATPLAAQTPQPAQAAPPAQPAQAAQPSQPASGEAATVKKLLEQKFAGATVKGITKSPYFGLYEVQFEDQLIYTDAKVNYILVGSVYDANTRKNLTEAKLRQLNRVAFDSLPLELSFKRVKGNGERKLAIFSDADCPFCARLEQELKNVDNVTIYTFLFPIDQLHPDAARKSKIIWCAPDKVKAWNEFFATGKLPDNDGTCDNPVAATNALGQKLKVQATPTLVFADGTIVPGALPAERLESEMTQAQAAAGPVAATKK
jgi:thiol:disulfide interchange protein DsbC